MLNIKRGISSRDQKVVIYGPEGIGKTTLAAHAPDPLFIDTEGGTAFLNVKRIDQMQNYENLLATIKEVAATPGICKTLVIDTVDWAEKLMIDYICKKYNQKSIESFSYGKGYTYIGEEFSGLLKACDEVIAAKIHVIILAHAKIQKFEQPDEMGAYDRWQLKLSRQAAPLLKEWCDHLLFCNYQTYVVASDKGNTKKAQGGKRVIYTSHHPTWDAKTRANLPEVIDLDYRNIATIFEGHETAVTRNTVDVHAAKVVENAAEEPETQKNVESVADAESFSTPLDRLRGKMAEAGIAERALQKVVASKGHYPADTPISGYSDKFIAGWCLVHWEKIVKIINAAPEGLPEDKED